MNQSPISSSIINVHSWAENLRYWTLSRRFEQEDKNMVKHSLKSIVNHPTALKKFIISIIIQKRELETLHVIDKAFKCNVRYFYMSLEQLQIYQVWCMPQEREYLHMSAIRHGHISNDPTRGLWQPVDSFRKGRYQELLTVSLWRWLITHIPKMNQAREIEEKVRKRIWSQYLQLFTRQKLNKTCVDDYKRPFAADGQSICIWYRALTNIQIRRLKIQYCSSINDQLVQFRQLITQAKNVIWVKNELRKQSFSLKIIQQSICYIYK